MASQAGKCVLFLGTGNHDRSRVAEILFNAVSVKMGLGWTATSRGLAAKQPTKKEGPMAAGAVKAIQQRGLRDDALTRNPVQVTEADVEGATVVIAMNRSEHELLVRERFPAFAEKVRYWQIAAGADSFPLVEREVSNLVARLLGGSESEPDPPPPADAAIRAAKQTTVKVGRETKGRKGKGVTLVSDLPLAEDALQELATLLKTRCGTGGTVKDGRIEIQGDQRDRLTAELERLGYKLKRAGG